MTNVRAALLGLSLLSTCAIGTPGFAGRSSTPSGAFGNFLAGRFAAAEADPVTAAVELSKAAALDPSDPDLATQAFLAAIAAERPDAVALAKRVPADNQFAQLVLAGEDMRLGRWDAAEQRYRALPRQGLTQLLQPLLLAWAQQGAGKTELALQTLRPFAENPRFRGIFALHAAMIADLGNRKADATHYYELVAQIASDTNLRLAQVLASWMARNNQPDLARQLLTAMGEKSPEIRIALPDILAHLKDRPVNSIGDGLAETYVALAASLRTQEQGELSLLMLNLAFRARPDFAPARLLQEEIETAAKHYELALKAIDAISPRDPLTAMAQLRRAALLAQLDKTDEAIDICKRLAAAYPDSALPDIQLGDVLRAKKRWDDAVEAYSHAIAHIDTPQKNDWPVFYERGTAYERAGKWPLAEADLKMALQLSPGQPLVLNYLGYTWADMGRNLTEARDMLLKAAEARKNDGAVTDSLGWVLYRIGDIPGAVQALERAVELEPEDPTISDHLGDAYFAAGRTLEARYEWKRALTLKPTPEDASKLEAKLKRGQPTP